MCCWCQKSQRIIKRKFILNEMKKNSENWKKNYVSDKHKKLPAIDPREPKEKKDEVRQYVSHFYIKKSCCFCLMLMHEPRLFYPFFCHRFFIFLARFFPKSIFSLPVFIMMAKRICSETCKPTAVVVIAFCAL